MNCSTSVGRTPTTLLASDFAPSSLWSRPSCLPWLPLLARAFDAELPATPEMAVLAEEGHREKLHESVLRFLEVELSGPSAIEIEDAHHMDDASADLLGYLTMRLEGHPWLFAVSRRPGETGFEPPRGAGRAAASN